MFYFINIKVNDVNKNEKYLDIYISKRKFLVKYLIVLFKVVQSFTPA